MLPNSFSLLPVELLVRVGEHVLNVRSDVEEDIEVADIKTHTGYSRVANDIALVKLKKKVKFSAAVRPACIPRSAVPLNAKCIATGWGTTSFSKSSVQEHHVIYKENLYIF